MGVFKSTDGGASWAAANAGMRKLVVVSMAVDPMDSQRVYAGTQRGLFVSLDGGTTWKRNRGLTGFPTSIVIDPSNPDIIYAGAGGLYKTVDGGKTWKLLKIRGDGALVIDPVDPIVLYENTD